MSFLCADGEIGGRRLLLLLLLVSAGERGFGMGLLILSV